MKLKMKLDEAHLQKKLAEKIGKHARRIVLRLHVEILDRTPMNTGRTLGSWFGSATPKRGKPIVFDIASRLGKEQFRYLPGGEHTNTKEVGTENGREFFENYSLSSTKSIRFEQDPYRVFHITNGATLDSGFMELPTGDEIDSLPSTLNQGPGSRATAMEYGLIASFDLYESTAGNKVYSFTDRGTYAMHLAVEKVRLLYGR